MKKMIVCLSAYLIVALSFKVSSADEGLPTVNETRVEHYISNVFKQIDFSNVSPLSYEVFDKAYRGYLNLRNSGKLNTDNDVLTVCDLSLPSTQNRMWIIDLAKKKVLFNTYVAHGEGSGEEIATSFSNSTNSHKTSLGFYVTGDIYEGEHGTSLRLNGMDYGYNDAAFDRGVVVHGANYVCDQYIAKKQKLGRSWGCPAVPPNLSLSIVNTIKYGTCLFIYYPDSKYLNSTCWLNKKITALPENNMLADALPARAAPKPRVRVVEYMHNGVVDSVKSIPLNLE